MRRYPRLLACLPLVAGTACASAACAADAIAGPELAPEPLAQTVAQAAPQPAKETAAEPRTVPIVLYCSSSASAQSGEPLIIVDGVPWGRSREELVALDMESIEVLTDVQLVPFYGNRTISDVIIIKTRGGASRRPAKPVSRRDARH